MKKLLLFSFTLLLSLPGKAQLDTITTSDDWDYLTFFPNCVVETFSVPDNPYQQVVIDVNCPDFLAVTEINYVTNGFCMKNFQGLEHFINCTTIRANCGLKATLYSMPPNLDTLIIEYGSQVQVFPQLPASLRYFEIHEAHSLTFPEFPEGLNYMDVSNSFPGVSTIGSLPSGLKYLNAYNSSFTTFPTLPDSLEYFDCSENFILAHLPQIPASLEYLDCSSNDIDSLTFAPNGSLRYLDCSENDLHRLVGLPNTLEYLNCEWNRIGDDSHYGTPGIPFLPDSIKIVHARYNQMRIAPEMPEGLVYLDYFDNYLGLSYEDTINGVELISGLPELPSTLKHLDVIASSLGQGIWEYDSISGQYVETVPLHPFPELPEGLEYLGIDGICLPTLPYSLDTLFTDMCLPNIPNSNFYNYPLCTDASGCDHQPLITGTAYYDANNNCVQDTNELVLQNRVVQSSGGTYAITDENGNYNLFAEPGTHSISQFIPNSIWDVSCPGIPYSVTMDSLYSNIPDIDFPNTATQPCHWLTLDVGSYGHSPCFYNDYHFQYCNLGSEPVIDAYIDVELPADVIPIESYPPGMDLGNGIYRIPLGDIGVDECGSAWLMDSVDCNAPVNATVCIRAEIFPISPCFTPDPGWDQSVVTVDGQCLNADTLGFVIGNEGAGNMSAPSNYRIYQNNALYQGDTPFQLNSGETLEVLLPTDGNTYTLEADQSPGHAGTSMPRDFVEACGYVQVWGQPLLVQEDDLDHHIEVHCEQLTASYDPNDKRVVPGGIGPQHIVHPNDSLLEYMIRFQNTGTDTAHNVTIRDTLDVNTLNPLTFVSGASSHNYEVMMEGHGVVTWHFNDIMLPDSNVNEPASNGFVKFHIQTQPDLPNGTLVNNSAAIYFDYNDPIITNTSFITIDDMQILVGVEVRNQLQQLDVYPNPAKDIATAKWNEAIDNGSIQIRDASGRIVLTENVKGLFHELSGLDLPQGFYTIQLVDEGQLIGTSKLSVLGQ